MRRLLMGGLLVGGLLYVALPAAAQSTPTITLSLVDSSDTTMAVTAIGEDGGAQSLQVKAVASAATAADVTVSVTVGASGSTATLTTDYTRSASSSSVTINMGATEGLSSSFTITPVVDTSVEGDETIRFTPGTVSGYTVNMVDLTLTDQTITLSLVDSSDTTTEVTAIGEDGGAQTLQVKAVATAATSANVTVSVTIAAGTATLTTDYTGSATSTSVTITSGQTEALSTSFTVTPVSDTITENHETIRFTGTATGYTVEMVDLTITDQDRVIRVDMDKTMFDEPSATHQTGENIGGGATLGGVASGTFTASTTSTYSANLSADVYGTRQGLWYWIGDETAGFNDVYFENNVFIDRDVTGVSITAGDVSTRFSGLGFVTVVVYRDTVVEPNELFHVTLEASDVPGFTVRHANLIVRDVDTRVGLTVDTDSNQDGNQTTLAEGASGANVSVSGAFDGSSSVIGSATVVTLSAAGKASASASAGEADTDDLTYSP